MIQKRYQCRTCGVVAMAEVHYFQAHDITVVRMDIHKANCGATCENSSPVDMTDKGLHCEAHCGTPWCNGGAGVSR